jgi:predicted amidophosphoribosyltransferase
MLLVAKELGRLRHFPVEQLLVRNNFLVQHRANRKDRLTQAITAFKVKGVIHPDVTYILIDDVVTTGATISQAALLLKSAGATTIWVATTSRQPLD